MSKKLLSLIVVVVFVLSIFVAPIVSASMWKSSTLDSTNEAIDAINQAGTAVKDFDAKAEATSADFDALLSAYKNERSTIENARDKAKSVGGFKGLDLTGDYKKATETSDKLTAAYDELLKFNAAETASSEAEQQILIAFEQSGTPSDAATLSAQAQKIRAANEAYQEFLNSPQATEVERQFSAILTRLADALETSAQAVSSGNIAQLDAADRQLQAFDKEIDAIEPLRVAQTASKQQNLQVILDKLNVAAKELE